MKTRIILALLAITVQLTFLAGELLPATWLVEMGIKEYRFYLLLKTLAILGPVPLIIAAFRHWNMGSATVKTIQKTDIPLIVNHLLKRVGVLVAFLFFGGILTLVIASTTGGYEAFLPPIITAAAIIIYIIGDSVLLFIKEKDSPKFCVNLLLILLIIGAVLVLKKDYQEY